MLPSVARDAHVQHVERVRALHARDLRDGAGRSARAKCHTLRHLLATHLLEDEYDIRTLPELLGHRDVRTTMMYTHVLDRGRLGVRILADGLVEGERVLLRGLQEFRKGL